MHGAYQVIKNRHQIVLSGTHDAVVIPLVRAHRVVAVHGTLAFLVQASHHAEGVVREEAAVVQGHTQKLGDGGTAHCRGVAVLVLGQSGTQHSAQGGHIGHAAGSSQHSLVGSVDEDGELPLQDDQKESKDEACTHNANSLLWFLD